MGYTEIFPLFLSTLREHEHSPGDEIPEASWMHPSQARVEKKRAGSMFIVSGSSTVFRSWTAGISTGTGRVQTVRDVADFTWRAFNNREEHSEDVFYSGEKGFDENDTVSLFL